MHLFDLETKMYERSTWAEDRAGYIVLGEIFKLCLDINTIHAINDLMLSNIVMSSDDAKLIKMVQQLP
tara:strand:+ start:848 stop:1051 length:204 start_codon:yes stop_codon:yes gene_type:complete